MEQQRRAEIFGTGEEPIRHFVKLPERTFLAKGPDGKLFPVAADDPRAIGFTPYENVFEVQRPDDDA